MVENILYNQTGVLGMALSTINAVGDSNYTLWIKWLAIFGFFWIISTFAKTGINLIYVGAYAYGLIKWLIAKARRKDVE